MVTFAKDRNYCYHCIVLNRSWPLNNIAWCSVRLYLLKFKVVNEWSHELAYTTLWMGVLRCIFVQASITLFVHIWPLYLPKGFLVGWFWMVDWPFSRWLCKYWNPYAFVSLCLLTLEPSLLHLPVVLFEQLKLFSFLEKPHNYVKVILWL